MVSEGQLKKKYRDDFDKNVLIVTHKCHYIAPGVLSLTPDILDQVADDCMLTDMYGRTKTKAEFLKDRKGILYTSRTAGPTIYGFNYNL